MTTKSLEATLTRKLPVYDAEIDEVCVSFYPTLNPEFLPAERYAAKKDSKLRRLPAFDEHAWALGHC